MNKRKPSFEKSIEALLAAGNDIVRAEDETHYVHVPTGQKLLRCTNFIDGLKPFGMTEGSAYWGSLAIGTAADQLFRDYFVEGEDYVREQYNAHNTYSALSQRAVLECLTSVRAYDASVVKAQGWKVLADRVFLYSLELGVAGEVDLILYNEATEEIKIVDMKTERSPSHRNKEKVNKHTRQLNTYRVMAEELMGGRKVTGLEIMWIKVWYEKYESESDTAYLHEIQDKPFIDVLETVGDIWMAQRGHHFSEHKFETPRVFEDGEDPLFVALNTVN